MHDHTRVISQKYAGLWKQAGLAKVGCHVRYFVASFVVQSTRNKFILYFSSAFPLPITSNFTQNCASHPLAVLTALYLASPQLQQSVPRDEQLPQGLVISAKNSCPEGLTSISKQLWGQLSIVEIKTSTTSSLYNGSLQFLQVEMIYLSILLQLMNREVVSWQREAVVELSSVPLMRVKWSSTGVGDPHLGTLRARAA